MVKRIVRYGLVVAASVTLLGFGDSAFAQQNARLGDKPLSFGAQVNWSDDAHFGVGGRVILGLDQVVKGLEAIGSFDYYFPGNDLTFFEINSNAVYKLELSGSSLRPYFGGGLNIARASVDVGGLSGSDTKVGLNILGGVLFAKKFFGEAKFEAGGGETFVVTGGIRF